MISKAKAQSWIARAITFLDRDAGSDWQLPVMQAIWSVRWDAAGQKPWEIQTAQLGEKVERISGRAVTVTSIHLALNRLEDQGCLVSRYARGNMERGGRASRIVSLTEKGKALCVGPMFEAYWF